jgi:hypothetical protein
MLYQEFAQPLHKGSDPLALDRRSGWTQVSDGRHFRRLLRTRSDRPCCGAAEQCDECPSPHRYFPPAQSRKLKAITGAPVAHRQKIWRPMSQMGHFRQIDPLPMLSACPLRSDRVRTFAPQRIDAVEACLLLGAELDQVLKLSLVWKHVEHIITFLFDMMGDLFPLVLWNKKCVDCYLVSPSRPR